MSKLYVGNLSWSTTDDTLRNAFAQYGQVVDSIVMSDRDTGRSRGFGFVTYSTTTEAQAAIAALNDQPLDGRNIKVNFANPKGGAGGGGGGQAYFQGGQGGGYAGGAGGYGGAGQYGAGGGYANPAYGGGYAAGGYGGGSYGGQPGGYGGQAGGYGGQAGGYGGQGQGYSEQGY